jgi:hypothetical protein
VNALFGIGTIIAWCTLLAVLVRLVYVRSTPLRHKIQNRAPIKAAITLDENDRFIQDQEHQIWPDATFEHVNCAICGPGPLLQGTIPSKYAHPFFRKETQTRDDGYGTWSVEALVESNGANAEMVSSAVIENGKYTGKHTVMLDLDFPATLVQSTRTGHHHLYIDHLMSWHQYRKLLKALAEVDLIEQGYYRAAVRQSATMLRPPWVKKELPPARAPRPNRPSAPPNMKPWDRYRRRGENR